MVARARRQTVLSWGTWPEPPPGYGLDYLEALRQLDKEFPAALACPDWPEWLPTPNPALMRTVYR